MFCFVDLSLSRPLHIAIAERNCGVVEQILDIMTRLGMSLDRYNNYKQVNKALNDGLLLMNLLAMSIFSS